MEKRKDELMNRRRFLERSLATGTAAMTFGAGPFSPRSPAAASPSVPSGGIIPYGERLVDRLWMWGHDSGTFDGPGGPYNIPVTKPITMADAIKSMGIPNVCVIRGGTPDAAYREQFKEVKRVAWVLSCGSNASYLELKDYVFSLFDQMPNLSSVFLDDFFNIIEGQTIVPQTVTTKDGRTLDVTPSSLSIDEMAELHEELSGRKNRIELGSVLYTYQLGEGILPTISQSDFISYWTWTGKDLQNIEENFRAYRSLFPKKRTMLGIYMWDFGAAKPLDMDLMRHQLDTALKLYRKGEIEGMIFHCTPLCNKKIEAVQYARDWIAHYGDAKQDDVKS